MLRATRIVLTELAAIRGSNSRLRLRLARNCDECTFEFFNRIGHEPPDAYAARTSLEQSFAVPPQGGLHIVSFDGASPDEAAAARGAVATSLPDMMWLPVVGLDRHTPVMGVRVLRQS